MTKTQVYKVSPFAKSPTVLEEPTAEALAIAAAVRDALLRYVAMNHAETVELMDLRPIIVRTIAANRKQTIVAPQFGVSGGKEDR